MKVVLKFLILGCFLIASQPLFSKDFVEKRRLSKKTSSEYKKHLKNTVWIVPPSTLLAYEYLNGHHIPIQDQTVWVIKKYERGYFFGTSYTALNGTPSSKRKILGSITPNGDVYITFYPLSGSSTSTDIVNGVGTFERLKGNYTFVMQMNSSQNSSSGLSHWSYMTNVEPKDYFYQHLPGINISVPKFISQF